MTCKLVFVHGRAQENKDSIALKQEWINAFKQGLAKSGLGLPLPEADIRFPYYGQTLYDLVEDVPPEQAAAVVVRGTSADEARRRFMLRVLEEIKEAKGITDAEVLAAMDAAAIQRGALQWEWVQGLLEAIDTRVPGASGASIALSTYDVYQYLNNPAISAIINAGVIQAMESHPTVVVSHSLGTVVAYNIIKREGVRKGWKVPLFMTLGSPLAVTAIREARDLRPIESPACVGKWFNAMDSRDVVALYPLKKPRFDVDPEIENKTDVDNHTKNRHGIAGYLDDAEVARRIHNAVVAAQEAGSPADAVPAVTP